jgi:Domain of unknown function (DUF5666)
MRWFLPLAFTAALFAADEAPIGIVRGDLVAWEGQANSGEMKIANSGRVLQCGFDGKTYFERDNERIAPGALAAGDRLEVVADHKPGAATCYARTVHVIETNGISPAGTRARARSWPDPTEAWAPRGDMTFSGLVVRLNPEAFTLRTRTGTQQTFALRPDTRFLGDGLRVDAKALKLNTRVFVRAGRNLDDEIEAYQIIWGQIVEP